MGGNIVELFPEIREQPKSSVEDFMETFIEWCEDEGIDTHTHKWKMNASSIMSIMKAMKADVE